MRIKKIFLEKFRNYKKTAFSFDENITVVIGPNGSGKTNVLEAISLLSTGKSRRVTREEELIHLDSDYARVSGTYDNKDSLDVVIQRKEESNRVKKTFKVNGAIKPGTQFIGNSKTVLFGPEDIRLVAGSPSRRREYLDRVFSQSDGNYRKNFLKYTKVLRQRNKLLEQLQGQILQTRQESLLEFWSSQLVETGQIIQKARGDFFEYAKNNLKNISKELYAEGYHLELEYLPNEVSYERLKWARRKELLTGTTQVGPHRDDFNFVLSNKRTLNLKGYGSRGQQRTGVLCAKVLELNYMIHKTKETPVLLLDDIFSELDEDYRKAIESIVHKQQTIITTADESSIPGIIKKKSLVVTLT